MTVTQEALMEAVETSLYIYPHRDGLTKDVGEPGMLGRETALSHPLANVVGAASLNDSEADAVIARVKERFASQNKAFGWIVGPMTRPADLADRLQRAGLVKVDEMAGMVMTDLNVSIPINPEVEIREVDPADLPHHISTMARSYGMPEDVAGVFCGLMAAVRDELRIRPYLAYLPGVAEPVAFASMVYLPDSPIVLLGGAGTLEEHRGRGIYTSLVARRLMDARADGKEAAVIQAVRSTSAPIAANLGFREIAPLDFYAWLPAGATEH